MADQNDEGSCSLKCPTALTLTLSSAICVLFLNKERLLLILSMERTIITNYYKSI